MSNNLPEISFDNTEYAFAYKSNASLKKAKLLLSTMGYQWLVKLGTRLTPLAINLKLPVNGLIRSTIFEQFVGGETLEETSVVANKLQRFGVQVILDYGVEGKEGEANFDHACEEFIRVIDYAATQSNIPYMSIKVTGFARFGLLEKLDKAAVTGSGVSGKVHVEVLSNEEKLEWERVVARMEKVIEQAAAKNIGVLVDAEESWIQDPVDGLTIQMMARYNQKKAVVYNTVQLYRHDRLPFLMHSFQHAQEHQYITAVKLVRGAYMEKERKRAMELDYPSPFELFPE